MNQIAEISERLIKVDGAHQVRFRETLLMIDQRFAFLSFDKIAQSIQEFCEKPVADVAICYILGQAIVDIAETFDISEAEVIQRVGIAATDIGMGMYGVHFEPMLRLDARR